MEKRDSLKKLILLFFIITLLSPISAFCATIPEDLQQEVAAAMKNGKTLYDAYCKGPILNEEVEKEKNKINDFCGFQYNAYSADTSVYFIAEPPSPETIVFGRHYKISKDSITRSTKSCFILPAEPVDKDVVGAYVTHLLSDAPSEFHVFLSLKYKKPIYVITSKGTWKVESGTIEFLEGRK